jgi:hypothetical protein
MHGVVCPSGPEVAAQAYNPSSSEGKDLEDCGSRSVQAKSLQDPHLNQ